MKLKRLRLQNVCQHPELDLTFGNGLIGVLGANGSGKSNALNAAYVALSGDFSRHSRGKAGYIRQQAASDAPSFVEVTAEHGGTEFTVYRNLRRNVQRLVLGDREYTKAAEIEGELQDSLGITSDLLNQYVFVPQWQMFSFIGTEAERAKQFAELCNTTPAEKIWDLLGKQIDVDRTLADQVVDNSDELRQQQESYDAEIRTIDAEIKSTDWKILSEDEQEACAQRISDWQAKGKLAREVPEAEKRVNEAFERAKKAVAAFKDADAALTVKAGELAELLSMSIGAQAMLGANTQREKLVKIRERTSAALEKLAAPEEPQRPDVPSLDEINEALRLKQRDVDRCDTLLSGVDGKPCCPTCGTAAAQLADRLDEARETVKRLRGEVVVLTKQRQQCAAYDREHAGYVSAMGAYRRERKRLEDQLVDCGAEEETILATAEQIAAWKAAIADYEQAKTEHKRMQQRVQQLQADKEAAKASHKAEEQSLTRMRLQLSQLTVVAEDYGLAKAALEAHTNDKARQNGLLQRKAAFEKMRGDVAEQLARLNARLVRSEKARQWITLLESVRGVLHRNNLPLLVHRQALRRLTRNLNQTLEQFRQPFRMTAAEDLSLTACYPDGVETAAKDLSGGEKMVLASAYRIDVNELFAKQIGLLVLDEPTACVDAENVERMADVFAGLGRIARDRGHQIIVVTHEELLVPVFDQVIRIQKSTAT